jgi:beta-mannanase
VTDDPTVPKSGVLVGAWVRPVPYTQQGRIDTFTAFERKAGRTLDIAHTYRKWTEDFFTPSDLSFISSGHLLQLSWAGDDTRRTTAGAFDAMIRERAVAAKQLGKPFLLEWRWEMDRANLATLVWSAADYVKAWIHIHTIFDQVGATNVRWVWCPTAQGFATGKAGAYYPGDQWVDWVCADAYPDQDVASMADLIAPFLSWAAGHDKPVIIGEYGVPRSISSAARAAWLTDAAQAFRADPQVKAVAYYNENPDGNKLPRTWTIDDDAGAMAAFAAMAQDAYFDPHSRLGSP